MTLNSFSLPLGQQVESLPKRCTPWEDCGVSQAHKEGSGCEPAVWK